MVLKNFKKDTVKDGQLIKFAKDLQKIYKSEKEKRIELENANKQLKKYAEALNKTILELREANVQLRKQVKIEEREKLIQQKLIQANKMTSLGTFTSGIAHEINNPINFILANSQMILEIWNDAEKVFQDYFERHRDFFISGLSFTNIKEMVPRMLNGNIEGSIRISNIISSLKDYGRDKKTQANVEIDINKVINFSISILNKQIKKFTDSFIIKLGENLPVAKGDPQQIEQVIINIIQNSLYALPDKSSGVYVSSIFDNKSDTLKVIIMDEGIGIKKEILNRIIDPFFTTRVNSGGTGLGLYISHSIIKKHRGSLDIKSESGKGTEVCISLPVSERGDG